MRYFIPVTIAALLITALSAPAQNQRGPRPAVSPETLALYEPGEFKGVKYRLMKPIDFDPKKTYPLILSLHGAGGRGTGNIKNLRNWNEWLTDEALRRKHPCFVLAPQSPTSWFDPSAEHGVLPEPGAVKLDDLPEGMRKFGERTLELVAAVAENPDDPRLQSGVLGKVLEYIDTELSVEYKIDADRVYCLGHSMGGAGTFTAVYQHPDRFAAAIPSAGIFFPWLDANRLKDVPLWIFHGNDDKVVDYIGSRHPFERLQELNGNTKLTTVTGVGHAATLSFNYTGDDPEKGYLTEYASDRPDKTDHVWDWLFRQKRSGEGEDAALNKTLEEINNRFAAAAPCGFPADETGDAKRLVKLPIWGMAGEDDGTRTAGIKRMVERLRAAGNANVRHTEFPGASHSEGNAAVFSSVELVDWMLGFSRGE